MMAAPHMKTSSTVLYMDHDGYRNAVLLIWRVLSSKDRSSLTNWEPIALYGSEFASLSCRASRIEDAIPAPYW